jgi:hypothetical protein
MMNDDDRTEAARLLSAFQQTAKQNAALNPAQFPEADAILNCAPELRLPLMVVMAEQFGIPSFILSGLLGGKWLNETFVALLNRTPPLDDAALSELATIFAAVVSPSFIPITPFLKCLDRRAAQGELSAELRFALSQWSDMLSCASEASCRRAAARLRTLSGFKPDMLNRSELSAPAEFVIPDENAKATLDELEERQAETLFNRYFRDRDEVPRGEYGLIQISQELSDGIDNAPPLIVGRLLTLTLEEIGQTTKDEKLWQLDYLVLLTFRKSFDFLPGDFLRLVKAVDKAYPNTQAVYTNPHIWDFMRDYIAHNGLTRDLTAVLEHLRGSVAAITGHPAFREKVPIINHMLRVRRPEILEPGDPWGDRFLALYDASPPDTRSTWRTILAHCRTLQSTKPSRAWIKQGGDLLEGLGHTTFLTTLNECAPLASASKWP